MDKKQTGDDRRTWVDSLKALQPGVQPIGPSAAIGYSLIGAIGFLGLVGYGFDRWRGSGSTGLVVGILLGFLVGMYLLAKELWHR